MTSTFREDVARWWIYQRERFPLAAHLPLIAVFSAAAVGFSAALRHATPSWGAFFTAFVTSSAAFAQLRISDEFKDFEEDRQHRPYRPVPRGLVTLNELKTIAIWLAFAQLVAALLLDERLLAVLIVCWGWIAFMGREFFLGAYLRTRPLLYMATHMAIMPIIHFYATACDWLPSAGTMPQGLFWFVTASFFNGLVIETGRKIRHPADEEPGVKTYSVLWGRPRACLFWIGSMAASLGCAVFAASKTGDNRWPFLLLMPFLAVALVWTVRFLRATGPKSGRWFEIISALWSFVLYTSLGLVPLFSYCR